MSETQPTNGFPIAAPKPKLIGWVRPVLYPIFLAWPLALWTSTFAYFDNVILGCLTMLPATAILIAFMRNDSRHWPYVEQSSEPQRLLKTRITFAVLLICLPAVPVLFLNQALDFSTGTSETGIVTGKDIYRGKSGRRYYMIAFATSHNGPFGRLLGGRGDDWTHGGEELEVTRDAYPLIQPGRSAVALRTHKGLFGFPWYEAKSVSFAALSAER